MNPPSGTEGPLKASDPGTRQAGEAASLRGELRSILVLYLLGAVLPLLIGLIFGPESP